MFFTNKSAVCIALSLFITTVSFAENDSNTNNRKLSPSLSPVYPHSSAVLTLYMDNLKTTPKNKISATNGTPEGSINSERMIVLPNLPENKSDNTEASMLNTRSINTLKSRPQIKQIPHTYKQTRKVLSEMKMNIDLDDVALEVAIDQLRNTLQINILPYWNELELSGVTRDSVVSLKRLKNMPSGKILSLICKYVSSDPEHPIGYTIDEDGNIYIKPVSKDNDYEFRTYYIGDLVRPIYTQNYGQNGYGNNRGNNGNTNNNRNSSRSQSSQNSGSRSRVR